MDNIEELRHTLALSFVRGIGTGRYMALINEFGSAKMAMEQDKQALVGVKGITERIAEDILNCSEAMRKADDEIEECVKASVEIIPIDSRSYPQRLKRNRSDAPIVLYIKGKCELENRPVLSVVGTRGMTQYGKTVCGEIIEGLAKKCPDLLVVSGLASGIDVTAHEEALRCGLQTVAILGSGLSSVYPRENIAVANKIMNSGALVSEFRYKTEAGRHLFVERNRTVAAIADAVLVVESGERGGSLLTAGFANAYGVRVCAVPGDAGRRASKGCNNLIKNGEATLVACAEDIYDIIGGKSNASKDEWVETKPAVKEYIAPISAPQKDIEALGLNGDALRVAKLLQERGATAKDIIASILDMEISTLSNILFDLEMDDVVRNLPGDNYELV